MSRIIGTLQRSNQRSEKGGRFWRAVFGVPCWFIFNIDLLYLYLFWQHYRIYYSSTRVPVVLQITTAYRSWELRSIVYYHSCVAGGGHGLRGALY